MTQYTKGQSFGKLKRKLKVNRDDPDATFANLSYQEFLETLS